MARKIATEHDLKWFQLENYQVDDLSIRQITAAIAVRKQIFRLIEKKKPLLPSLYELANFYNNEDKTITDRLSFVVFSEHEKALLFMVNEILNNKIPYPSIDDIDDEINSLNGIVSKTDNSLYQTNSIKPVSVNTAFNIQNLLIEQSKKDHSSYLKNTIEKDTKREWYIDHEEANTNWNKYWYSERCSESVNKVLEGSIKNDLFLSIDLGYSDDEILKHLALLLPSLRTQVNIPSKDEEVSRFGIVAFLNIRTYSLIAILDLVMFGLLSDNLIVSDTVIANVIYSKLNIQKGIIRRAIPGKEGYYIERDNVQIKRFDRKEALRLISDDFLLKLHSLITEDKIFDGNPKFKDVLSKYKERMGIK